MTTNTALLNAAKRLKVGTDLQTLAGAWKEQQIGLLLSYEPDETVRIAAALTKHHAVEEFVDFVMQLAHEAENG